MIRINILSILEDILFNKGEVYRAKEADTHNSKAYYINFNERQNTINNMDYWMPIIRKNFPEFQIESYFYADNNATLWFKYDIKKHRKLKLNNIFNDNKE